eukprot:894438-Rhodomonas_salina.2
MKANPRNSYPGTWIPGLRVEQCHLNGLEDISRNQRNCCSFPLKLCNWPTDISMLFASTKSFLQRVKPVLCNRQVSEKG